MTDRRRIAVVGGLLAGAGGVLVAVVPALGSGVAMHLLAVGLVVAVGTGALWVAASRLLGSREGGVELPTPESRPGYRRPGEEFAALLDEVSLAGRKRVDDDGETARERLRGTLSELAVETLGRTDGWSRGTATDRLADGTWTDDETAASFFAGGVRPPVSRWAYLPVGDDDPPFARRARHVVAALVDRTGEQVPEPDATGDRRRLPSTGQYWPSGSLPQQRSTGLSESVTAAVLAASVLGVWFGRPDAVLAATLGIALAGAAHLRSSSPTVDLSRSLSTDTPAPGERVTVTVTVRNGGTATLADVRLVDGVPPGLTVVDGSPRFTTALRPEKAATFTYTVAAVAGRHRFEPGLVVTGDGLGATETITTVEAADGPTELDCGFDRLAGTTDAPRQQVTVDPGRRVGDATGSGVEFAAHREYRPGDPPARIDWNHRAKTGDLATVEFREPRLSTVAVLVDARPAAYVAPSRDAVPAPRHGAVAAFSVASQLLAAGVPVGFGSVPSGEGWTPPGAGVEQRERLRECLATDGAVPWLPPDDSPDVGAVVADLTARLDPDGQVVFVSPCCDDDAVAIARSLDVKGHAVTVLSPDPTDAATVPGAYGWLTRHQRLSTLREHDIPVRDWTPGDDGNEVTLRVPR